MTNQARPRPVGWQRLPPADLRKQLEASEGGLSSRESRRRPAEVGLNELSSVRRTATLVWVGLLFVNPLAIILPAQLGFAPLPPAYVAFLAGVVSTYVLLVKLVKRRLVG